MELLEEPFSLSLDFYPVDGSERSDPDQLLLFEIGELEKLIEEQVEEYNTTTARSKRRKRGSRLIPDNLPTKTIEYTHPENGRLCPIDSHSMQPIRWEESEQLDYIPAAMRDILHRPAVYACGAKHDEAKLITKKTNGARQLQMRLVVAC